MLDPQVSASSSSVETLDQDYVRFAKHLNRLFEICPELKQKYLEKLAILEKWGCT
jgi:hypothetical protein